MPDGILVMKWNERTAIDVIFKYPNNQSFKISNKTLLHVLNLHGFKRKPETVSLTTGHINFITYYSGREQGYYVILLLNMLENPEDYESEFKKIGQSIVENIEEKKCEKIIPPLYNKLD